MGPRRVGGDAPREDRLHGRQFRRSGALLMRSWGSRRERSQTDHRRRGQALAEFAIVAPIFFLLVFFVIQIGLIFAAQNGLVDGVRNAARRAATYRINDQSFNSTVWSSICDTIGTELDRQLSDGRT